MSTRPAFPGAAPARVIRSAAGRRPQSHAALQKLSARLDLLIRDAEIGARSHREFERQCDEAEEIAAGIRAAFRGPSTGSGQASSHEPVNPPLWQQGGSAAW